MKNQATELKSYLLTIPADWELKQCFIDVDCKTEKYEVLNLVPNKIVEKYEGKLSLVSYKDKE